MKVLHIINGLVVGGAESLLVALLPLLKKQIEVEVLLLDGSESLLLDTLKKYNIKIITLSNKGLYDLSIVFKLYPILKNYDLVHVHLFPSMYYVALAKLLSRSKVKLIFTEHSTSNRRLKSWFFRIIDRLIYLNYEKVVCITPEVKDVLIHLGVSKEKLCVVYNGIELSKFSEAEAYDRAQFGLNENDIILVMVAAFRREKDHSLVFKSLHKLDGRYKLMLIGDGYLRSQRESEVRELNLIDRVVFLGARDDVSRLLKTCNIGVLSSHWEGFGLAAVEAMAAGLPVVASNVPGLSDVVNGGGILFRKGSAADFSEKILALEDGSYYNKIKERCINKAKNYDLQSTADELIRLYKNLDR
ncbi:glycosyltransferase [Sphingobacterium sp. 2149]|uniref:glycosyltransferase n=1 Tax=Sphingobacterium sp. 2149 TaxID=2817763 RepID=UPI00285862FD|nr:glycosyltransferase [Sphingobacterium sp. 2149]MDR6733850.1 glycosyltransferase involved in cell wall biosynthesis [Sphingobacterium sp. 2149]